MGLIFADIDINLITAAENKYIARAILIKFAGGGVPKIVFIYSDDDMNRLKSLKLNATIEINKNSINSNAF